MRVSDVMSRDVEVVAPDATLTEAAQKMKALDVGPLPVCDGTRPQGMVTDRDIAIRAVAEGRDPNTTPVSEVMSEGVVSCYVDDDVREAVKLMEKEQIRRLAVLDRAKNLVGVVSLGDLATQGANRKLAGEALKSISEPGGLTGGVGGKSLLLGLVLLLSTIAVAFMTGRTGGGDSSAGE